MRRPDKEVSLHVHNKYDRPTIGDENYEPIAEVQM